MTLKLKICIMVLCIVKVWCFNTILVTLLTQQPSTRNGAESGVLVVPAGVIIQVM